MTNTEHAIEEGYRLIISYAQPNLLKFRLENDFRGYETTCGMDLSEAIKRFEIMFTHYCLQNFIYGGISK
jgi:hypothetical protein